MKIKHIQKMNEKTGEAGLEERPLNAVKRLLSSRDIEFVEKGQDFTLAHPAVLNVADLKSGMPFVLNDHRDVGALIFRSRIWASFDNVLAVLTPNSYTPRSLHNAPHYEMTYHGNLIREAYPEAFPGTKPQELNTVEDGVLDKIIISYSYGVWSRLEPLAKREPDLEADRTIDVQFAGTMDYGRKTIAFHREQCALAVERLINDGHTIAVTRGRGLSFDKYVDQLYDTKIVVSPWGFGERCHRDYEALLAGAVLVKPNTNWSETWPDIYKPPFCLWCKPDFSDLPEVVARIKADWLSTEQQIRRGFCREYLMSCRRPQILADRMAYIFKLVAEKL